jgi:hypothetical protein
MRKCIECDEPINESALSFEQRLIDDIDFCRTCFDAIMSDQYDGLAYLDNPRFLS